MFVIYPVIDVFVPLAHWIKAISLSKANFGLADVQTFQANKTGLMDAFLNVFWVIGRRPAYIHTLLLLNISYFAQI